MNTKDKAKILHIARIYCERNGLAPHALTDIAPGSTNLRMAERMVESVLQAQEEYQRRMAEARVVKVPGHDGPVIAVP